MPDTLQPPWSTMFQKYYRVEKDLFKIIKKAQKTNNQTVDKVNTLIKENKGFEWEILNMNREMARIVEKLEEECIVFDSKGKKFSNLKRYFTKMLELPMSFNLLKDKPLDGHESLQKPLTKSEKLKEDNYIVLKNQNNQNEVSKLPYSPVDKELQLVKYQDMSKEIEEKEEQIYKIINWAYQEIGKYEINLQPPVANKNNEDTFKDLTDSNNNQNVLYQTQNRLKKDLPQLKLSTTPHENVLNISNNKNRSILEDLQRIHHNLKNELTELRNNNRSSKDINQLEKQKEIHRKNVETNWLDDFADYITENKISESHEKFQECMNKILSQLKCMYDNLTKEYECVTKQYQQEDNLKYYKQVNDTNNINKIKTSSKTELLYKLKSTCNIMKKAFLSVTEKMIDNNVEAAFREENQNIDSNESLQITINELIQTYESKQNKSKLNSQEIKNNETETKFGKYKVLKQLKTTYENMKQVYKNTMKELEHNKTNKTNEQITNDQYTKKNEKTKENISKIHNETDGNIIKSNKLITHYPENKLTSEKYIELDNIDESIKLIKHYTENKFNSDKHIEIDHIDEGKNKIIEQLKSMYQSVHKEFKSIEKKLQYHESNKITIESKEQTEFRPVKNVLQQLKTMYENMKLEYNSILKTLSDKTLEDKIRELEYEAKYLEELKQSKRDIIKQLKNVYKDMQEKKYDNEIIIKEINLNEEKEILEATNNNADKKYKTNKFKSRLISKKDILNTTDIKTKPSKKFTVVCNSDFQNIERSANSVNEDINKQKSDSIFNKVKEEFNNLKNTKNQLNEKVIKIEQYMNELEAGIKNDKILKESKLVYNDLKEKINIEIVEQNILEKEIFKFEIDKSKIEENMQRLDLKIKDFNNKPIQNNIIKQLESEYEKLKEEYNYYIATTQSQLQENIIKFVNKRKQVEEDIQLLETKINKSTNPQIIKTYLDSKIIKKDIQELKLKQTELKNEYQKLITKRKDNIQKEFNKFDENKKKIEEDMNNIEIKMKEFNTPEKLQLLLQFKLTYQQLKDEYSDLVNDKQKELQEKSATVEQQTKSIEENIKILDLKIKELESQNNQKEIEATNDGHTWQHIKLKYSSIINKYINNLKEKVIFKDQSKLKDNKTKNIKKSEFPKEAIRKLNTTYQELHKLKKGNQYKNKTRITCKDSLGKSKDLTTNVNKKILKSTPNFPKKKVDAKYSKTKGTKSHDISPNLQKVKKDETQSEHFHSITNTETSDSVSQKENSLSQPEISQKVNIDLGIKTRTYNITTDNIEAGAETLTSEQDIQKYTEETFSNFPRSNDTTLTETPMPSLTESLSEHTRRIISNAEEQLKKLDKNIYNENGKILTAEKELSRLEKKIRLDTDRIIKSIERQLHILNQSLADDGNEYSDKIIKYAEEQLNRLDRELSRIRDRDTIIKNIDKYVKPIERNRKRYNKKITLHNMEDPERKRRSESDTTKNNETIKISEKIPTTFTSQNILKHKTNENNSNNDGLSLNFNKTEKENIQKHIFKSGSGDRSMSFKQPKLKIVLLPTQNLYESKENLHLTEKVNETSTDLEKSKSKTEAEKPTKTHQNGIELMKNLNNFKDIKSIIKTEKENLQNIKNELKIRLSFIIKIKNDLKTILNGNNGNEDTSTEVITINTEPLAKDIKQNENHKLLNQKDNQIEKYDETATPKLTISEPLADQKRENQIKKLKNIHFFEQLLLNELQTFQKLKDSLLNKVRSIDKIKNILSIQVIEINNKVKKSKKDGKKLELIKNQNLQNQVIKPCGLYTEASLHSEKYEVEIDKTSLSSDEEKNDITSTQKSELINNKPKKIVSTLDTTSDIPQTNNIPQTKIKNILIVPNKIDDNIERNALSPIVVESTNYMSAQIKQQNSNTVNKSPNEETTNRLTQENTITKKEIRTKESGEILKLMEEIKELKTQTKRTFEKSRQVSKNNSEQSKNNFNILKGHIEGIEIKEYNKEKFPNVKEIIDSSNLQKLTNKTNTHQLLILKNNLELDILHKKLEFSNNTLKLEVEKSKLLKELTGQSHEHLRSLEITESHLKQVLETLTSKEMQESISGINNNSIENLQILTTTVKTNNNEKNTKSTEQREKASDCKLCHTNIDPIISMLKYEIQKLKLDNYRKNNMLTEALNKNIDISEKGSKELRVIEYKTTKDVTQQANIKENNQRKPPDNNIINKTNTTINETSNVNKVAEKMLKITRNEIIPKKDKILTRKIIPQNLKINNSKNPTSSVNVNAKKLKQDKVKKKVTLQAIKDNEEKDNQKHNQNKIQKKININRNKINNNMKKIKTIDKTDNTRNERKQEDEIIDLTKDTSLIPKNKKSTNPVFKQDHKTTMKYRKVDKNKNKDKTNNIKAIICEVKETQLELKDEENKNLLENTTEESNSLNENIEDLLRDIIQTELEIKQFEKVKYNKALRADTPLKEIISQTTNTEHIESKFNSSYYCSEGYNYLQTQTETIENANYTLLPTPEKCNIEIRESNKEIDITKTIDQIMENNNTESLSSEISTYKNKDHSYLQETSTTDEVKSIPYGKLDVDIETEIPQETECNTTKIINNSNIINNSLNTDLRNTTLQEKSNAEYITKMESMIWEKLNMELDTECSKTNPENNNKKEENVISKNEKISYDESFQSELESIETDTSDDLSENEMKILIWQTLQNEQLKDSNKNEINKKLEEKDSSMYKTTESVTHKEINKQILVDSPTSLLIQLQENRLQNLTDKTEILHKHSVRSNILATDAEDIEMNIVQPIEPLEFPVKDRAEDLQNKQVLFKIELDSDGYHLNLNEHRSNAVIIKEINLVKSEEFQLQEGLVLLKEEIDPDLWEKIVTKEIEERLNDSSDSEHVEKHYFSDDITYSSFSEDTSTGFQEKEFSISDGGSISTNEEKLHLINEDEVLSIKIDSYEKDITFLNNKINCKETTTAETSSKVIDDIKHSTETFQLHEISEELVDICDSDAEIVKNV